MQDSNEKINGDASVAEYSANDAGAAEERRLLRKLDMRLLPMVILIYIMNYIDVSCDVRRELDNSLIQLRRGQISRRPD